MLPDNYQQLTRFLHNLADIPDDEMDKAVDIFRPMALKKHSYFLRAGEIPKRVGFLTTGILRLFYIDQNGTESIKSFCVENNVIAAYRALLQNEPARFFIQALEDSSLLVAPYEAYQELLSGHICWQILDKKFIQAVYIRKEKREAELLLDDAETRYRNFLVEYPNLNKRIKQHYIASYLGMTPVTLSRIRSKLKKINL
ncbi:MAG: Crp/Fnr family transcriptional regulator [Candidatus Promineifilaceae bacterium]